MKKACPKCNGTGSIIVDTKICDNCDGTGYVDTFEMKNHFKGVNSNARAKFDLDADRDVPCEVCDGKGMVDVLEDCSYCNGTGEITVCNECGKRIDSDENYCDECAQKQEEEKKKKQLEREKNPEKIVVESDISGKEIIYELDGLCEMSDLELNSIYRGKVTRVERYGLFVSLNNQVWGLMRTRNSSNKVGDYVFVRITQIKERKREVDMAPASVFKGEYVIKKVKKNIERSKIETLDDSSLNSVVKVYGEVIQIQQTSGPTIFTITDETAITWAAAFNEPGVRMYPEIEIGDIVEVIGEVNKHNGEIQIESSSIEKLEGEEARKMREFIDIALDKKAEPDDVDFLIQSPVLDRLKPKMREAAKVIRRAILDGRSILVRHHADADGICAGVAMEKAVIPLLKEFNPDNDAEYHYFKRSPSKAPFYELEDVVKDLSFALEDFERHGQKLPLIVLLDNGSTEEDIVALMQAKIYDIEIVVIDHHFPGELITKTLKSGETVDGSVNCNNEDIIAGTVAVDEYVDTHVNPYLVGGDSQITAGALATEVAHIINPDVEDLIKHLPAVAVLGDRAEADEVEQYVKLASEKGYDREQLKKIAECIDFEAYFLRFMNGRGIIDTILGVDNLDKHPKMVEALYKEYLRRVDIQMKATLPNVKRVQLENGIYFNVLDVEKYAHKFTFPAPGKTCGFVHDKIVKEIGEDKPIITLGHGPDFGVLRATDSVHKMFGFNVNNIVISLADKIPQAGIDGGGHECAGSIKYIEGLGKEVLNQLLSEIQNMTNE
ncbi:DHH family phosphoesterase [Methanobrevibacter sp.]|uniref:DHH family phosphoesterase n=1 Tax=Methanobrevibacter sp. TaxID=66852 RepID=UPI0025F15F56|nr:DHH family phosphoesterase [Methanobrevibacter sp.]MBQ2962904.1 DHH family phosphoesterase [Methanobrevibacter sp.]